jgi:hypothetical protein
MCQILAALLLLVSLRLKPLALLQFHHPSLVEFALKALPPEVLKITNFHEQFRICIFQLTVHLLEGSGFIHRTLHQATHTLLQVRTLQS